MSLVFTGMSNPFSPCRTSLPVYAAMHANSQSGHALVLAIRCIQPGLRLLVDLLRVKVSILIHLLLALKFLYYRSILLILNRCMIPGFMDFLCTLCLPNLSPHTLPFRHRPRLCDDSLYRIFSHHRRRLIARNANVQMARGQLCPSEVDGHRHNFQSATKMPVLPQSLVLAHPHKYTNPLQLAHNLLPITVRFRSLVRQLNQSKLRLMFGILCDHWMLENVQRGLFMIQTRLVQNQRAHL